MNTFPFQPSNTLSIDQAASCLRCGTKFYLVNGTHKSQPPQANDGRLACCLVKLPGKARSSMCERQKGASVNHVQRSPLFCAPGLVKFVPAVARLFCLALPGSFLNVLCAELSQALYSSWLFFGKAKSEHFVSLNTARLPEY